MRKSLLLGAAAAAVLALVLAACGGGSSSSGGSGGTNANTSANSGGGIYGKSAPATETSEAPSAATEAAPVALGSAANVGTVLVDSNRMTLYYFEKDKKGSGISTCEGACAEAWPPLLSEGEAEAMGGVNASMLGTIERSDGTTQVTYAGWPLYTFAGDLNPGEDNGTDSHAFGGAWYPLHANGKKAGH